VNTKFGSEHLKEKDDFGDICTILMIMDWIKLAQAMVQWWTFLNTRINLWVL